MTTIFNNSFDSSPNSDSDDDFMVDSIISSENKASYSESNNIKSCIPSWIKKDSKSTKMLNISRRNLNGVNKLPLKRCLSNNSFNTINKEGRYTKLIKLTYDNRPEKLINIRRHSRDRYLNNNSIPMTFDNSIIYNESNSNPLSPYTESDKTHSVESSPSCILINDPIITAVVLDEHRFNSSNDFSTKVPLDDNVFNDIHMSFDNSFYSTSIDDNLLRPMRYNKCLGGSNQTRPGPSSIAKSHSLSINTTNKIEHNKRSRSIGLDQLALLKDKRVRSNESIEIRKFVPVSVVSNTTQDCTHSTTTATVVNNYQKKSQQNTNGHNKRKHLLQFIIDLLKDGHSCVNWSNKKEKEFFIAQPEKLAFLWATYKNNNKMTFDSLARSLRLYYAPKKLERISGKKNHYRILNLSHEIFFNV